MGRGNHAGAPGALAILLCLGIGAAACGGTREETIEPAAGPEPSPATSPAARPAGKRSQRPKHLLQQLYAQYTAGGEPAILADDRQRLERWFDDELVALLLADFACRQREGGICKLDWDPFVAAQDWKVEDLAIRKLSGDAQHAAFEVTFENLGQPTRLHYSLVRLERGWRIRDIDYPSAGADQPSLKSLLAASQP